MLAASQTRDKTALTADGVEVRMLTASHPLYTCLPSTPLHPCTRPRTNCHPCAPYPLLQEVIKELRSSFDYIVCDSPAGIENGATQATAGRTAV